MKLLEAELILAVEYWSGFGVDDLADEEECGRLTDIWTACESILLLRPDFLILADDLVAIDEVTNLGGEVVET